MAQNNSGKNRSCKQRRFCDICYKSIIGNVYKFKAHLYQHRAVEAKYKCSYCSKEYYRKDAFVRHVQVHTGTGKRYICDYCNRDFVDKRNLISHLRIHDDGQYTSTRYTCKACGVKYCEERLLKYHIRKEHFNLQPKEKSFEKMPLNETWVERVKETNVCVQITKINNNVITIKRCDEMKLESDKHDTTFTDYINSVLAKNDKSQYSKAVCDYCKKEMLKKSLQNHIRERHLNLKRFKCKECERGFNRHYQLINHTCGKFRRCQRSVQPAVM